MMGVISRTPQPTYPRGFPPEVIATFERIAGRGMLGNKTASGTEIIKELGDEHVRTGKPIVYTSADSVLQIAAHEEVVPLPELYRLCAEMRAALTGPHAVGRVIARPFVGSSGAYARDNEARHDWALPAAQDTALDILVAAGLPVRGVGKIQDIFAGRGITSNQHALNNAGATAETLALLRQPERGMIFTNLIEFDMVYGHRKNSQGYADALAAFDASLPEILGLIGPRDALFITGDHGVDPTTPGTDHTREFVPLLAYGYRLPGGTSIGTRKTFADLGATIVDLFDLPPLHTGASFAAL
jgi:phosphopentomutase